MPNGNTFSVKPIGEFVQRYVSQSKVSVDPFSRDCRLATYTNDLNPNTHAEYHLDAEEFLYKLKAMDVKPDLVLFDPPYSPRQISELYKSIGLKTDSETTQNARLYKRVRDAIRAIIEPGGIVLSFGWNSSGMGNNGVIFELEELLMVCHGGAHNDTICLAERCVSI